MGLNVNSLKFLLLAHAQGACFQRVLMIGRQTLSGSAADIRSLAKLPISAEMKHNLRGLHLGPEVYAEQFFQLCGAEHVDSMDKTNYEGATVEHDLNLPVPASLLNTYDLVVDGGSLEHVFNFPVALRSCMAMLKVGGHFVCDAPTNNYSGHGFYQFSPELFFAAFAPAAGFALLDACLYEANGKNIWYRLSLPSSAARRITFQNRVPTHLLILARKTTNTADQEYIPQQRMYNAAWTTGADAIRGSAGFRGMVLRGLTSLPPRLGSLLLNTWNIQNRFRTDMFTREG